MHVWLSCDARFDDWVLLFCRFKRREREEQKIMFKEVISVICFASRIRKELREERVKEMEPNFEKL